MAFDTVINFLRDYLGEVIACLTLILDVGMLFSTRLFLYDVTCLDKYDKAICDSLREHHFEQVLVNQEASEVLAKHRAINAACIVVTGFIFGAVTEVIGNHIGISIGMFGYLINSLCLTFAAVIPPPVSTIRYIFIFVGITAQGLFGERNTVLKCALGYALGKEKTDITHRQVVFQGISCFGIFTGCMGVSLALEVNPREKNYIAVYVWLSIVSLSGVILPLVTDANSDDNSEVNDDKNVSVKEHKRRKTSPTPQRPAACREEDRSNEKCGEMYKPLLYNHITDDKESTAHGKTREDMETLLNDLNPTKTTHMTVIKFMKPVLSEIISTLQILFRKRLFHNQIHIFALLSVLCYVGFLTQWLSGEIVLFTFLPHLNWGYFEISVQYIISALCGSIYGIFILPFIRKLIDISDVSVYILCNSAYTFFVLFTFVYSKETWTILVYSPLLGMAMCCKPVLTSLIVSLVDTKEVGRMLIIANLSEHTFKLLGGTVMFYIHSWTVRIYPLAPLVVNFLLSVFGYLPIVWYILDKRFWDNAKLMNIVQ